MSVIFKQIKREDCCTCYCKIQKYTDIILQIRRLVDMLITSRTEDEGWSKVPLPMPLAGTREPFAICYSCSICSIATMITGDASL